VAELPGGYWDAAGTLHRKVELAQLTGREEELFAHAGGDGAALVTSLLSRCLRQVGGISPVPPEVVAGMLVADRIFVLLRLRAAWFGEHVRADVICPWPDCGERVSLTFALSDVPIVRSADPQPVYTRDVAGAGAVTFRLPTGADQQALAGVVEDETRALTVLLSRCVLRLNGRESPRQDVVAGLPAAVRAGIGQAIHDAAPRVDQSMEIRCAECGRSFPAPFDVRRLLFGELRAGAEALRREVHYLAFHYHWSEREILGLTRDRRRDYIGLLTETVEMLNDGG
jgi:hypothetical protein